MLSNNLLRKIVLDVNEWVIYVIETWLRIRLNIGCKHLKWNFGRDVGEEKMNEGVWSEQGAAEGIFKKI